MQDLVTPSVAGLQCRLGGFHIDPSRSVSLAVITHAHADHARPGSDRYLCAQASVGLLRQRLGPSARIEGISYGQRFQLGETTCSLHPAGHVLGSAQVRIEARGEVWVVSGDYKRGPDPSCAPFEVVPCDTFVTECTFGLPIYRWPGGDVLAREILEWWDEGRALARNRVIFAYSLGKAQRILAELARFTDREVLVHPAVEALNECYRQEGVRLLPTRVPTESERCKGELVIVPPGAAGGPWVKRLGEYDAAFASGWMRVRGSKRRGRYERGFVISDHADWPGLVNTVLETGAKRVLVMHGDTGPLVRYLRERGVQAEDFGEGEAHA